MRHLKISSKTARWAPSWWGLRSVARRCHSFTIPSGPIYLLGSEATGLPERVLEKCNAVIALEAVRQASYNVAVTGSIVMYHRTFLQRCAFAFGHDII